MAYKSKKYGKRTKRFSKRTSKRKYSRKTARKIRGGRRSIAGGVLSGMPATRFVRMRYNSTFAFSTGILQPNVAISFKYRANSIYDPELTTGSFNGHKPMGFDYWRAYYNSYRVIGAKCTARFVLDPTTVVTEPMYIGVCIDSSPTLPYSTVSGFVEAKRGVVKMLTGKEDYAVTVTSWFSAKKLFGAIAANNEDAAADFFNVPLRGAFFHVWQATPDPLVDSRPTGHWNVILDYVVQCFDPKTVEQTAGDPTQVGAPAIGDTEVYQTLPLITSVQGAPDM